MDLGKGSMIIKDKIKEGTNTLSEWIEVNALDPVIKNKIEQCLSEGNHLIIDAHTGLGKTVLLHGIINEFDLWDEVIIDTRVAFFRRDKNIYRIRSSSDNYEEDILAILSAQNTKYVIVSDYDISFQNIFDKIMCSNSQLIITTQSTRTIDIIFRKSSKSVFVLKIGVDKSLSLIKHSQEGLIC